MWYVLAENIPDTILWWGPYVSEKDADDTAKRVNGVAIKTHDWTSFKSIMDKVFAPLQADERVM